MPDPDFRVFPGVHDDVLDRYPQKPEYERAWFREDSFAQAADLNELESRQNAKRQRVGDLVANDGDRISGAEIITVDLEAGTYRLTAGKVYVRGDVREVEEALLEGVTIEGDVQIGVRLVETVITHEEDPDLLGQYPGIESSSEQGSLRTKYVPAWGWSGDGGEGALYAVYSLRNGYVIDQSPPPTLSGVNRQIADYDFDAHGNYIADGCLVRALGKLGDDQVFSIGEGVANVLGFKFTRYTSTRYAEEEAPDIEEVDAEVHVFVDDEGSSTINVNHAPINGVISILVEKEITETIARGTPADTKDLLSNSGVLSIVEVVQGATTYVAGDDYLLTADQVDWTPAGAEPDVASSYDVTYRYLDAVAADALTDTSITVSGGVDGGQVQFRYTFKLPRVDRICIDQNGQIAYLKGISSREQPQPPRTPTTLLALAEVHNDWFGTPAILNNGIRDMTFKVAWDLYNTAVELKDLLALERLRRDISAKEPNAKHTTFVDPFTSDRYRDAGADQDAAVFNGTCQIAIDPTFIPIDLGGPVTLDYDSEVIIRQELSTGCMKVNEYQVFNPLPITVSITPSEDFWEVTSETWLSPVTRVFGQGNQSRVTGETVLESIESSAATFLRQIDVSFTIGNLAEDETVDVLTFDGVDVDPGGLVGDVHGEATGTFTIPANVTVGVKELKVVTGSGAEGSARFEGRGVLTEITRQLVTDITRWTNPATASNGWTDGGGDRGADPLAQTFMLDENRFVSAIEVKFCTLGDTSKPVICEIVTVDNGIPTRNVVAQTEIDMSTVIVDTWVKFEFGLPVFVAAGAEHAFVFKTDDDSHALRIATRGAFDAASQKYLAAQPYTVGVLLSSSNARTWTPHQNDDLTMRIHAALFDPTTKVVDLGTHDVTDIGIVPVGMSDLIVAGKVFLATDQASLRFRVTPAGETAQLVENGQNLERRSYFNGEVQIEAVLTGTSKIAPILSRNVLAIPGSMRASGTYVSEVFAMGTDVRQDTRMKTRIPVGATLAVSLAEGVGEVFEAAALAESETLTNSDLDQRFTKDPWTAATGGRLKVVLTGTPAARPSVYDLRAYSAPSAA